MQYSQSNTPDFLIKSTLACATVLSIILIPFLINAIIENQLMLSLLIFLVLVGCGINICFGIKNNYNLPLNKYFLSPVGTIAISYAFFNLGTAGSYWAFVLLLAHYFVLPEKLAWLFMTITMLIFIPASSYVLSPESAPRFVACLVITSLFITLSMREIYKLHDLLKQKAITDPLTGLYNRSSLTQYLQQTMAQSTRSGIPMTLISLDIDHFKHINDRFGHHIGDEVLINLSSILKKRVRESDRVFRVGGEEFLICLHDTDEKSSTEFAEDLRKQVELNLQFADHPITISLGVAGLQQGMEQHALLVACDKKLYQAKKQGRNCVVV